MRRNEDPTRRLERYNEMRNFGVTAEPSGAVGRSTGGNSFVVQQHAARRMHWDFRLEHDGVLVSWAVPKGPSLVPGEKRLAVQTEDHPIDYRDFEGTIPEGQYGAGAVIVWDLGTWTPIGDPDEGLAKGHLEFELDGEKLHGRFFLIKTRAEGKQANQANQANQARWLLMKRHDEWQAEPDDESIVVARPESVLTGRTIDDVKAGVLAAPRASTKQKKKTTKRSAQTAKPTDAEMPPFGSIEPELATAVRGVPEAGPWLYEIKYDGYRTLAWLDDGKVAMASRRGLDWSKQYADIADALSRVRAKTAIFDGEVAYVLEDGRTDFQKLQNAIGSSSREERSRLVYYVFDLLYYDGVDLRDQPLLFRKDKLRTILAGEGPPLKLSDHVSGDASAAKSFFDAACKLGLEGIIGKRADRPYVSKRCSDWIKVKCEHRQEFVIVGYTPPKQARSGVGALVLGLYEGRKLQYVGKVGTGFTQATLRDLHERLHAIETRESAFVDPPPLKPVFWVKPELVCEVRFFDWTTEGILRNPSYQGLRGDKLAKDVHRELEEGPPSVSPASTSKPRVDGVIISHPERVIDPESGLTKLDFVHFAADVAETMFPFIVNRPLMLLRAPGGTQASKFHQADARKTKVKAQAFVQKHGGMSLDALNLGKDVIDGEHVLFVTKQTQLVMLAQNNAIELHGWGCTLPDGTHPDWIVFDLDPDEPLPFATVVEAAFELRAGLRTLKLESWVKTTGGKGLHVVVPIARKYDWPTVRRASETIATLMAKASPHRYVATMSKAARQGKIYIDYLRNAQGATAILPYSARARPGLPVATPIAWKDLRAVNPEELTIATVPKLVARRKVDPWADLLEAKQTLPVELVG